MPAMPWSQPGDDPPRAERERERLGRGPRRRRTARPSTTSCRRTAPRRCRPPWRPGPCPRRCPLLQLGRRVARRLRGSPASAVRSSLTLAEVVVRRGRRRRRSRSRRRGLLLVARRRRRRRSERRAGGRRGAMRQAGHAACRIGRDPRTASRLQPRPDDTQRGWPSRPGPAGRRLRARGARRRGRGHPRRRLPGGDARAHRPPPRRAARLRRAVGLRGRPRRRDARARLALGVYADEVMADPFPVTEGVTGWVVTNRRTRNVERSDRDPLVAVVQGTVMEPESLVSVPLLVEDRVVGGAQRLPDRRGQGLQRRPRSPRSSASPRWRRSPSTPPASATRCASRRARTASPDCSTTAPATSACARRSRAPTELERPLAVVVLDLDHFKADQRRLRPRRGRQGARRRGRAPARASCASTTSWRGWAARSSR